MALRFLVVICPATAQQAGTDLTEYHPPLPIQQCFKDESPCVTETTKIVLDSNWRATHAIGSDTDCIKDGKFVSTVCSDWMTCSMNCVVEGIGAQGYAWQYGVNWFGGSGGPAGVKLSYVSKGSVGSRLFLLQDDLTYKMLSLRNREFAVDVDMSRIPCGVNAAIYLSEMKADGAAGKYNSAGASYGTGYCDAQCPRDVNFVGGEANMDGKLGSCCAEMDLWEANKMATAVTAHPCNLRGFSPKNCTGDICDGGLCDQPGCDLNPYRLGSHKFYGPGSSYAVDTTKVFTVVTRFRTSDNTDQGDLVEIERLYIQDGKTIGSPHSTQSTLSKYNLLSDEMCADQKKLWDKNVNEFKDNGGMKAMGEALHRGMVLVLSIWDDPTGHMKWLDGTSPAGSKLPGAARGPCADSEGDPKVTREKYSSAYVAFTNIRYGEVCSLAACGTGSTTPEPGPPSPDAGGDPISTAGWVIILVSVLLVAFCVVAWRQNSAHLRNARSLELGVQGAEGSRRSFPGA